MYADERGVLQGAGTEGGGVLHGDVTARVIRAFYAVHWELGYGFLEKVYVRALAIALSDANIGFELEAPIPVSFRGRILARFRSDLLVERRVLVEVKSARSIESEHLAQLLNYLRATDIEVGLLLNFGIEPQFRRLVYGNARKSLRVHPRTSAAPSVLPIRGEA